MAAGDDPVAAHSGLAELLDDQRRCYLAFDAGGQPEMMPLASWWDGRHVWVSAPAATLEPLRGRQEAPCAVWVPGLDGWGASGRGAARVYEAADPLALALHAPVITAAVTALAAANAAAIAEYLQDAARAPARLLRNQVVVRIRVDELAAVAHPPVPPGVAPALPPAVPADVRRRLSGARRVVVAFAAAGVQVLPAVWGAGFALTLPSARQLPQGSPLVVVVDAAEESRPSVQTGLALYGEATNTGALRPARVRWWEGGGTGEAEVPAGAAASSGIVLPD